MASPSHEFILDLEPDVSAEDGRRYHASLVARGATDGHWNAWLEFVGQGEPSVLRTGIETHQAGEAALHHWAASLTDVYLGGALDRAQRSPVETIAHRWALRKAATPLKLLTAAFDPFMLFALGEHVLRRELQLLRRATLLALIIKYDLNPRALNVSTFTRPQLVAFIVTAVEVRDTRNRPHGRRSGKRAAHAS
jgi:hypothetical protein